jgi:hypothetical protein
VERSLEGAVASTQEEVAKASVANASVARTERMRFIGGIGMEADPDA